MAVLPDPTTTYRLGGSSSRTTSLTVTTRASSATEKGAGDSAGMLGERWWALTTRHDGGTSQVRPEMRETTVRPTTSHPVSTSTRPVRRSRSAARA